MWENNKKKLIKTKTNKIEEKRKLLPLGHIGDGDGDGSVATILEAKNAAENLASTKFSLRI